MLQFLKIEISFASQMAILERTNSRAASSSATLLFPSPLPGDHDVPAKADPGTAVSSRSKPEGLFCPEERSLSWLSMSQQFLVSSVLWVTYLPFSEMSRQRELAGLMGLEQVRGGL